MREDLPAAECEGEKTMKVTRYLLAATALCAFAAPAFAQESTEDSGGIQDIVVTAQKRAEKK